MSRLPKLTGSWLLLGMSLAGVLVGASAATALEVGEKAPENGDLPLNSVADNGTPANGGQRTAQGRGHGYDIRAEPGAMEFRRQDRAQPGNRRAGRCQDHPAQFARSVRPLNSATIPGA